VRILYLPHQHSQQRQHEKKRWIYPVLLAMQAQYYRDRGEEVLWSVPGKEMGIADKVITEPENIPFDQLPAPDRIFTNSKDPKYQRNGNFKYHPATYIQVADGCWWGRCSFCVEKKREWKVRPVFEVHKELKSIKALGFREVFDDSGSFPIGEWLDDFLGFPNPGLVMGCNCRMVEYPWRWMKKWGFRMILFGLESANQRTLDKIHKGVRVEDVKHIEEAAKSGLDCHVAVQFGYPWESEADARNTLRLVHRLLKTGVAKTAQASFHSPNGTPSPMESQRHFVKKIYEVAYSPRFWFNKVRDIKNVDDLKYLGKQISSSIRK